MFFRLAIECALSVRIKFTLISKTEKDEAMNKKQCRTCFTQYTVCRRAERKTGAANESRRTELKAAGNCSTRHCSQRRTEKLSWPRASWECSGPVFRGSTPADCAGHTCL